MRLPVGAERLATLVRAIETQAGDGMLDAALAAVLRSEFALFAEAVREKLTTANEERIAAR